MKVIQIFYFHPRFAKDYDNGPWLERKYQFLSISLSCLLLREQFEDVTLITDKEGKALLIDTFQLPYTRVEILSDEVFSKQSLETLMLAKLYALQLQTTPFLFVDSDFYWWDSMTVPDAEVIFFKPDVMNGHQRMRVMTFDKQYFTSPLFRPASHLFNTKILGGTDVTFFSDLFMKCKETLDGGDALGEKHRYESNPALLDCLFCCMLQRTHKSFGALISAPLTDEVKWRPLDIFGDFRKQHHCSFIPRFLKQERNTLLHLTFIVRFRYPLYWKRVCGYFENDAPRIEHGLEDQGPGSLIKANACLRWEKQFARTKRALEISSLSKINASSPSDFITGVKALIESGAEIPNVELVKDVFNFEKNKWDFTMTLESDQSLIDRDRLRCFQYEKILSLTASEIVGAKYVLASDVLMIESHWKWGIYLDIDPLYPLRVTYNMAIPAKYFQTLCWPETETYRVREYDLDQFDMILLDAFKEARTLGDALGEVKEYFEPEDNLFDKLKHLAVNRARELCYLGALQMEI